MHVLLLRPVPENDRFGLGPFFTIEPLGLDADGTFRKTPSSDRSFALDDVPAPERRDVDAWRRKYACLLFRPVWLIETARGCPFRCSFCSVWPLHDRAIRLRSIDSVCA